MLQSMLKNCGSLGTIVGSKFSMHTNHLLKIRFDCNKGGTARSVQLCRRDICTQGFVGMGLRSSEKLILKGQPSLNDFYFHHPCLSSLPLFDYLFVDLLDHAAPLPSHILFSGKTANWVFVGVCPPFLFIIFHSSVFSLPYYCSQIAL